MLVAQLQVRQRLQLEYATTGKATRLRHRAVSRVDSQRSVIRAYGEILNQFSPWWGASRALPHGESRIALVRCVLVIGAVFAVQIALSSGLHNA
jgi:hypothetical protein